MLAPLLGKKMMPVKTRLMRLKRNHTSGPQGPAAAETTSGDHRDGVEAEGGPGVQT